MSNTSQPNVEAQALSEVSLPKFKDAVNELERDALVLKVLEAKSILFYSSINCFLFCCSSKHICSKLSYTENYILTEFKNLVYNLSKIKQKLLYNIILNSYQKKLN